MRITSRVVAPIIVVMLGVGIIATIGATAPKPEKKEDIPFVVNAFVERAEVKPMTLKVRTQGEVRPKAEVDLVSQVSGRILSISPSFVEGGEVEPGALLVQVDPTDYEFSVTNAEARVAEMEAKYARTQADAEIVKRQWEDWNEGEPSDLALKKPQLAEATANLKSAESSLNQARVNLSRTKIALPFKGRVREKMADVGQVVSAGSKLGRVFSTEVVELRLPLSDRQLAQLNLPLAYEADDHNGPRVTFSAVIAGKQHEWEGHIVRTAAAIDPKTRMVYATAEVDDPYGAGMSDGMPLAVGLFVNAAIEGNMMDNALIIPRSALRTGDKVYVINKENKLSVRDVNVLASEPDFVILQSGIEPGEMVATSPLKNIVDGMTVVAINQDTASSSAVVKSAD